MSMIKTYPLCLALLMASAVAAASDPLPYGAKTPTAQKIEAAYLGKTGLWKTNCNGGIYYGPGGTARAWCADESESLGAGPWSVDNYGRLCTDLIWYWPDEKRAGSSPGGHECILHVEDRWGYLWRNWPPSNDWWPMSKDKTLVRGYRFQTDVLRTKSRLGI